MERFNNKVALVTGGSRGIGEATALRLAEEGAKVGILAQDEEKLNEVAKKIREKGGEVIVLIADVTDEKQIREAVKKLTEIFGEKIHVLVNCAGVYQRTSLENVTEEGLNRTMDVNVKGTLLCSKVIAELMKTQSEGGKIVNISSVTARIGGSDPVYAASKAAIIGMTRSLAQVLAPYGINVNVVVPGPTKTDMTKVIPPDRMESLKKSIPLKRLGEPEEIAAAIVFLASDDANYITGASLDVNGGLAME